MLRYQILPQITTITDMMKKKMEAYITIRYMVYLFYA